MKIFVVIATWPYERGYDVVGARRTREEAKQLAKDAESGRFLPSKWDSEFAREYCDVNDVCQMLYEIKEVTVE